MRILQTICAATFLLIPSLHAHAQIVSPRPSPLGTLKQKVALTEVEVVYSRPGVKGRKVFGDVVPYGELWRTGANAPTTLSFADDVTVGDVSVPAGKYALLAIPGPQEWTLILSEDGDLASASAYKQENDAARITLPVKSLKDAVETFTIDLSGHVDEGANLVLSWERTAVEVPIRMDIDSKIEAAIKATLIDGSTEPDASAYYNAATFYMKKDKELDKALEWMVKAVEKRPEAFWFVHQQAVLLGQMGRNPEAIVTAQRSLLMAKENKDGDFGYVKRNQELIDKLKN